MFDKEFKVESFGDFMYKYFRVIYRLFINYIPDAYYAIIHLFQKVFRKSHCSDYDLMDIANSMAPTILRKLKAFREIDQNGCPVDLEMEEWLHIIDEMIFAFEYSMYGEESKFYKKSDLLDPYRETEDNASYSYSLDKDGNGYMMCSEDGLEKSLNEGWKIISKDIHYFDMKLLNEYGERSQKGMELFGKYFWGLWD